MAVAELMEGRKSAGGTIDVISFEMDGVTEGRASPRRHSDFSGFVWSSGSEATSHDESFLGYGEPANAALLGTLERRRQASPGCRGCLACRTAAMQQLAGLPGRYPGRYG